MFSITTKLLTIQTDNEELEFKDVMFLVKAYYPNDMEAKSVIAVRFFKGKDQQVEGESEQGSELEIVVSDQPSQQNEAGEVKEYEEVGGKENQIIEVTDSGQVTVQLKERVRIP